IDADALEALLDGPTALVGRQDALPGGDQGVRRLLQIPAHSVSSYDTCARSAHLARIPSPAVRSAASSSSFRSSSTISSTPARPSRAGTPTYTSEIPYSPVHHAHVGSTSLVSPAIALTICAIDADG